MLTSEQTPDRETSDAQVSGEAAAAPPLRERRGAPRHLIKERCIISLAGTESPIRGWNCIAYNISATGIGVLLPLAVQPGTLLEIEPWGLPGATTLRARVVHTKPLEFVVMCGCEFVTPLGPAELHPWLRRGQT